MEAGCPQAEEISSASTHSKPVLFALYHYMPPDEVVSAIHFGEICSGLTEHGWSVSAFPCVWSCRDETLRFSRCEQWNHVRLRRLWRPRFRQASSLGRVLNAIWMIGRWSLMAVRLGRKPDVLLIGTDPVLSILAARVWRVFHPKTKIVHWCFDLYPEAAIAEGLILKEGRLARMIQWILRPAYAACSLIVDLGPCMRNHLMKYPSNALRETIVPWALDEPEQPIERASAERKNIFGDARLSLLYSGNFGLAHSYSEILRLAELLQPEGIRVAFSVGGNCQAELKSAVARTGLDIPFVPLAKPSELRLRLACADVHIVTLRPEWTGMVVPSKFFGALSAGRPILFAGSPQSSLAQWIDKYNVGWTLNGENAGKICEQLLEYADSAVLQQEMRARCFSVYQEQFSKKVQIKRWNEVLRSLLT